MGDYSYYTFENSHLCTRGLHRHDFPLLLWDALVQTGYWDRAPEYYGWLYEEHGLQRCEVYVDILSHPVFTNGSPWSTWAIGADMDDAMEKVAHIALIALCSQNLVVTAGTPISVYPIQDRSDPEWKVRMDEVAMSFRFISTVVGRTWLDMPSICFSCSMTLSASSHSSDDVLLTMQEVKGLTQEISRKAQEVGVVRQQVRNFGESPS
jgi:hypothetical protein